MPFYYLLTVESSFSVFLIKKKHKVSLVSGSLFNIVTLMVRKDKNKIQFESSCDHK